MLLGIIMVVAAIAQPRFATNYRSKKISTIGSIVLDSLSIVPNSFFMQNLDTHYYKINYNTATLFFNKNIVQDSVVVQYRVFPFSFAQQYQRFKYDSIKDNFVAEQAIENSIIVQQGGNSSTTAIDFGKLNYSGTFGRSISFGNTQNATYNSQLNLQMNGIIGDSIELLAAITDNNIPIQPDGTTQRLNEFDKILLQFKKRQWQLSLGDVDIKENENYFLKFYKRAQGIYYSTANKNNTQQFQFAGAIAKGKFARNVFNGQEGNQGPYKLQGNNNELYFMVLAGTEKVFIDGELLKRGEDNDYIINYNTAEVVFTPKRMITKDRRLQIEFEYADRNYLNSMFYVKNKMQLSKKLTATIAAYNNSDAKNSPINQQLDNNQKQFLANLGNNYLQAFYPYESLDSFSTTKILYKKIVNPNNSNDSIYVYSTNKDSAKYSLYFAEVGANKGNYIPYFNGTNGKVYQYIQPINGLPQGNYEPALFLVTPKKQQVVTIATIYQFNKNTLLKTDLGYSNYDVNTFSSIAKDENKGYAAKLIFENKKQLNSKIEMQTNVGYEYVQQNFKPVERLRNVEFERDWGLPIITNAATQHLPKIEFVVKDAKNNLLQYISEAYLRSDNFNAFKHSVLYRHSINNYNISSNLSYVHNTTALSKGFFIKPNIEVSKLFTKLFNYTMGISYAAEHNENRYNLNDSLLATSYAFAQWSIFIKSNQQKANKWSASYFTRTNQLPSQKTLITTDKSDNYNLQFELLQHAKHRLKTNITYRELQVYNSNISNQKADNSLLGRVEYYVNEFDGMLTGYTLYEFGAGQEQKRDFSFIEVQAGRGQYTWNDYNADGIAQLNEFEIAQFADQAKYVKIFTPTNQFIKANYTQFNYSCNINPQNLSSESGLTKWVKKFNLQSALQLSKKIMSDGSLQFNPFDTKISDTALINFSQIFSNTLSFNRSNYKWGIDITNINNYNKALLTYGLESKHLLDWIIKTRFNIATFYTIEVVSKLGKNQLSTPAFNNRNYSINHYIIEPKLSYTYLTKYRVQASYQYANKLNVEGTNNETAIINSLQFDAKYNATQNTNLVAKFTYSKIGYNALPNTTISYIMLDGLLVGKNYLWNIELIKRLNNNFEISLNYEGRKSNDNKTINIGRASFRALL